MERITYRITLDAHKAGIQRTLQGFETGDNMSRRIAINLMASGDTYEIPFDHVTAMMYVTTSGSKEPSINDCAIENNTIIYDILQTDIESEGIVEMQLKLVEGDREGARTVLCSPKFALEVSTSNTNDKIVQHTAVFTSLENAIAKANSVFESRMLSFELSEDCVLTITYADGGVYENDILKNAFLYGEWIPTEENLNMIRRTIADLTKAQESTVSEMILKATKEELQKEISDRLAEVASERAERKAEVADERTERKAEIAVERARIDNLQAIPEGGTSADAALYDINIGYDGTDWKSPGAAVRGQIGSLSSDIVDSGNVSHMDLSQAQDGFINIAGKLSQVADWYYLTDIQLKKGQTIELIATGYNDTVAMISEYTDEKYVCLVASIDSKERKYTYKATKDITIAICFYNEAECRIIEDVAEIRNQVIDLNETVYKTYYDADIDLSVLNVGFINVNGVVSSLSTYGYTDPISIKENETISIIAQGYEANVAMIAKYSDGVYTPLVLSIDSTTRTYSYTATEDIEVVLSMYTEVSYLATHRKYTAGHEGKIEKLDKKIYELNHHYWAYNIWKVLCIGDSLTSGSTHAEKMGEISKVGASIDQNYPRILGRMLNAEVTNGGFGGAYPSSWWNEYLGNYNFSDYDTFIIWFGTNQGLKDTLDTEGTEANYYCKLIEKIKADTNNNCLIVVTKIFATGGNLAITNSVIEKIATKYELPIIDNSDLSQSARPELHCNIDNPHFGKAGNIYLANRVVETLAKWFEENPLRGEYGYSPRTN